MKTTLFSFLLLLMLTFSAHAQRFVCGLSGTITFNGVVGDESLPISKRSLLTKVATSGGRSLDPKTLQLVYDTTANQFQVVQKADGALVVVVYYVVDVKQYGLGDGSTVGVVLQVIRQADLTEPGTPGVVGTVGGEVGEYSGVNGGQTVYGWPARFSVLSPMGGVFAPPYALPPPGNPTQYLGTPSLIQGQFTVHGTPFVPSGK